MRLDHIAYRVADRHEAAHFFVKAFGYVISDEFKISFDDGTFAECFALRPPEVEACESYSYWCAGEINCTRYTDVSTMSLPIDSHKHVLRYHLAPEIFVSDGSTNSIVANWVAKRGGVGGIHHMAYEVEDVAEQMHLWRKAGYGEFTTDEPISHKDSLTQCFTVPHPITGVVYEFIKKGKDNKGFNVNNVRDLMESTQ